MRPSAWLALLLTSTVTGCSSAPPSSAAGDDLSAPADAACGAACADATPAPDLASCSGPACPPAGLSYATNPASYTKGAAITPNVPTVGGGAITGWSVQPPLPAGLSLDGATGVLGGTPTALAPAADYAVTAANAAGSTSVTLRLAVVDVPPSGLVYADAVAVFSVGRAITDVSPTTTGGAVTGFTIAPALPAGLALSPTMGVLSGTPTVSSPVTTYTVTASNSGGSVTATLSLGVFDFDGQRFLLLPQNTPGFNQIAARSPTAVRAGNGKIYLGTEAGLSTSADGGATWVTRTTFDGLANNGVRALALAGTTLVVGTEQGLSTTADGVTFTASPTLAKRSVSALAWDGTRLYAADNNYYAGSHFLRSSTDGGLTFPTTHLSGAFVRALSATPTRLCAGTNGQGVKISTDGGQTFTTATKAQGLGDDYVYSVYCAPGSDLVLAGTTAGLAISTDGGATFVKRTTADGLCASTPRVWAEGGTIHAVSSFGYARSTDGGATFSCKQVIPSLQANDVFASGSTVLVTHRGGLCQSTDGGLTFDCSATSDVDGGPSYYALRVEGQAIDVGGTGGAFASTSGGASFTRLTALASDWVYSIARLGDLVAVGGLNLLQVSTSAGASFVTRTATDGLPADGASQVALVGTDVYVANYKGLGVSLDRGATFAARGVAEGLPDNRVRAVAAAGGRVYAATLGGLGISTDRAATFLARTTAQGLGAADCTAVHVSPSGQLYLGHAGKLSRSTDGGATFVATDLTRWLGAGQVASIAAAGPLVAALTQDGIVASLDEGRHYWPISTRAAGSPAQLAIDGGRLFVVSSSYLGPGGLFKSEKILTP